MTRIPHHERSIPNSEILYPILFELPSAREMLCCGRLVCRVKRLPYCQIWRSTVLFDFSPPLLLLLLPPLLLRSCFHFVPFFDFLPDRNERHYHSYHSPPYHCQMKKHPLRLLLLSHYLYCCNRNHSLLHRVSLLPLHFHFHFHLHQSDHLLHHSLFHSHFHFHFRLP